VITSGRPQDRGHGLETVLSWVAAVDMLCGVKMIDTARLRLAAIPPEVAGGLLAGRTPPGWAFAPGYPSEFSLETMQIVLEQGQARSGGPFFIVRKDDEAVVGEIGASIDPSTATAQVGYSVVEPSWGHGYATEALRGLLSDLLATATVRRVMAQTMADHVASRRVMEKAGMVCRGRRTAVVDGEVRDLVVYQTGPVASVREPASVGEPAS
jgi:[ribosomal protein S5]-alanine N-acetyltransferase